jgi:hypothetical protein
MTPTDKAAKNFSFVCKNYYKSVLAKELAKEDGAYISVDQTPQEIWSSFLSQAKKVKLPEDIKKAFHTISRRGEMSFPLLYWLPKMHKEKPKARFVAASAKVFITPLAKFLNSILIFLAKELQHKDYEHIRNTGVKRCWFIDRFDQVASLVPLLPSPTNPANRGLATYDFSTMYTTLDLDDHIKSVGNAVNEAFGTHQQLYVTYDKSQQKHIARWPDPRLRTRDEESSYFSAADVKNLVQLLVKNTYIQNGQCIKQQILGIPIGTNPAPSLANLHLYDYESKFMDDLMKKDLTKAQQFIGTWRLIDDILSVDNPLLEKHLKITSSDTVPPEPLYPDYLELNKTTSNNHEADFLGMEIKRTMGTYEVKVAPSKKRFPYPRINYPSLNGNFPAVLGYGVYTGQLFRFSRICTRASTFLEASLDMAKHLLGKAYAAGRLSRAFDSFLQRASPYPKSQLHLSRAFRRQLSA